MLMRCINVSDRPPRTGSQWTGVVCKTIRAVSPRAPLGLININMYILPILYTFFFDRTTLKHACLTPCVVIIMYTCRKMRCVYRVSVCVQGETVEWDRYEKMENNVYWLYQTTENKCE